MEAFAFRFTHRAALGITRRVLGMASGQQNYSYKYPRPGFTVDTCIIACPEDGDEPSMLLIQRKYDPFAGKWALPGGFVDQGEPLDSAAARELQEETGVDASAENIRLEQVGAFGDPGRDPRGWTVTAAYVAIIPSSTINVKVCSSHDSVLQIAPFTRCGLSLKMHLSADNISEHYLYSLTLSVDRCGCYRQLMTLQRLNGFRCRVFQLWHLITSWLYESA